MEARGTFWQHIKLTLDQEKRLQNRLRAKCPYKTGMNTFGRLGPQSRHDTVPQPCTELGWRQTGRQRFRDDVRNITVSSQKQLSTNLSYYNLN
jgi:hypothetical protein